MTEVIFVIVIFVLALLAGAIFHALSPPHTFRLERRALISAPPEKIFPLLNDLHAWRVWSPWEKLDPEMKRDYGGAQSGVGANYGWDSKKAGAGRMEIVDSTPPSKLGVKLDFIKPMEAHNMVEFLLQPQGAATKVTWAMYGPQPFFSKLMGIVFSMDKIVGKDFEAGLANLKAAAEK
jgi:hypothetical protein